MSSTTIQVLRDGPTLLGATDIIYSPDDNGYYFSQADFAKGRGRVSAKVYPSESAALKLWRAGKVQWEDWH